MRAALTSLASAERVFAVAHTETSARGNVHLVETRATALPGGRFLLTGTKSAAVSGDLADYIIISARTNGDGDDPNGISLFLLDPTWQGVTRRSFRMIDGGTAADVVLQDVEVGSCALLGTDGQAGPALLRAYEHFIAGALAEAVGIMDAIVRTTADYLKTRRAHGTTLSTYQALQHRLADMLIESELSRSMLMRVLHALSSTTRTPAERMWRPGAFSSAAPADGSRRRVSSFTARWAWRTSTSSVII